MIQKILRIHIKNFKVFTERTFDFKDSNLIVLDGPNGFGKTSFYDAVELLITGQIRRFISLNDDVIFGRPSFIENPYLNSESSEGDIIIKAELVIDDKKIILARIAKRQELKGTTSFDVFKLYELIEFNSEPILIDSETPFLTKLFGSDYKENFEFLNYIEQDDNGYLLRKTEKDKKEGIIHLFNVSVFQDKIDQFENLKNKLKKLRAPIAKSAIDTELKELKVLEDSIVSENDIVKYDQLIIDKNYYWDNEKVDFIEGTFSELLGENGTLKRIESLIKNKKDFKSYRFNHNLEIIIKGRKKIEDYIKFSAFIDRKKELQELLTLHKKNDELIISIDRITINLVDSNSLNIIESIRSIVSDKIIIENYENSITELRSKQKTSNDLSLITVNLENSRKELIKSFNSFLEKTVPKNDCPLCGFDWDDSKSLNKYDSNLVLENISKQSENIKKIIKESSSELSIIFTKFKSTFASLLKEDLNKYKTSNKINEDFITQLQDIDPVVITQTGTDLQKYGIDLNGIKNENMEIIEINSKFEKVLEVLKSKTISYASELIQPFFKDTFTEFFSDNEQLFEILKPENIENKIKYIQYLYLIHQSESVKLKRIQYSKNLLVYDTAFYHYNKLDEIIKIYKNSLDEYNRKIIKEIEILFHIYSGRIVQDFQGGLGLFISADKGIKFLTNSSNTFDAVFTMSSGQLSALVISFTLALNKKYSQNQLLFIDDPIQTMDELNVAGFTELLRSEFKERQIFISTHEDNMSTYIRYKFEKYGLKTQRVDMKELN